MKHTAKLGALVLGASLVFGFASCNLTDEQTDEQKEPVTYTVTISDGITNGSVSASKTSGIAEGETITLTITPEEDCALSALSVKNGDADVTVSGSGNTRTFAMPAANVTVGATFSKTTYIGSKKPSLDKAVGDIVFSDGSATPYSNGLTLTDEQKAAAVAIIFYANSDGTGTLGAKTLGVGLNRKYWVPWCSTTAKAYNTNQYARSEYDGKANTKEISGLDD